MRGGGLRLQVVDSHSHVDPARDLPARADRAFTRRPDDEGTAPLFSEDGLAGNPAPRCVRGGAAAGGVPTHAVRRAVRPAPEANSEAPKGAGGGPGTRVS